MPNLKFKVKNLGSVRDGEFTQKPLTLFCGPNNSGKTWVMYSLYHCQKWLQAFAEEKRQETADAPPPTLENFNKRVSGSLNDLFNTTDELLHGAKFQLQMESAQFDKLLDDSDDSRENNPFLMPAERNGLHLFFRELSTRRVALLHHASREKIDLQELLKDVIRSPYAIPIALYIDWLNRLPEIQRKEKGEFHTIAEKLKKELAGGAYKVDGKTGNISFKPYKKKRDGIATQSMGLHMTSSTVKSLFSLWFYLENQAKVGDLLMIDEPELNIHPENQRKIARILARLINAGLHIVISTHSDYIVRELNTLILLGQEGAEKLRVKHNYTEDEILTSDKVAAYLFNKGTIKPFEITPNDGIYATTFDDVIADLNNVNDDIYYGLRERKQDSD